VGLLEMSPQIHYLLSLCSLSTFCTRVDVSPSTLAFPCLCSSQCFFRGVLASFLFSYISFLPRSSLALHSNLYPSSN
jgi:hypothetical protein